MIVCGLHSASILIMMMMHRSDDDFAAGTSLASASLHHKERGVVKQPFVASSRK